MLGPLATVALLGALAACGSTDPAGTSPTASAPTLSATPPTTTGGETMSPPHDPAAAEQVTVVQTGGLKPVHKTLVFALDRPSPDGFSRDDVRAVLRAAADPELETAPPTPRDACCDRYLYRITIAYPDGSSTAFTTVEGASTSPAITHLLNLVS